MTNSSLQASDVWLLLAVQYSSGAGTKEKIVEAGDFINHAIFTDEEFNGGVRRLLEAGYILEKNNKYSVTSKFKGYWNNGISSKKDAYGQLQALEKILLK